MSKLKFVSVLTFIFMGLQVQASELVVKPSPYSVSTTLDNLAGAVKAVGGTVFARVDHAAGAKAVDLKLRPTELLIFGNPKLGAPAMQIDQSVGLDLPLRVVAYEDESGKVFLSYHLPEKLTKDHDIPADAGVIKKMTGVLDKLTNKAIEK